MAITKPMIFTNISIRDNDGANSTNYTLPLNEGLTLTITPATTAVENGQTLTDYFDATIDVASYNASLLSDTRIYTDTALEPVKARIGMTGDTGSNTLWMNSVILNGSRVFDGQRIGIQVTGSKRVTNVFSSIQVV